MSRYVALLRGINVGGKNVVKMADLKTCLEDGGFDEVVTYIQSGNVVFDSPERSTVRLVTRLEGMLSARFGYDASVVLRTAGQMRDVVDAAPEGFGTNPETHRCDVLFLMPGLDPSDALPEIPTREGVDEVWAGPSALYFRRLTSRAAQSRLSRIVGMPMYQRMTIRNWNTTNKLLELVEGT